MDTPQGLSKAMKWAIEVLNEGGDLNSLLPEERSPSPRHIPAVIAATSTESNETKA